MPKSSQRDTDGHSQSSLTSEIWGSSIGEICGWVALLRTPELDGCTQPLVPWNGHSLGAQRAQRPLRAYERSSRAEPPLPLNREIPEDRRERLLTQHFGAEPCQLPVLLHQPGRDSPCSDFSKFTPRPAKGHTAFNS